MSMLIFQAHSEQESSLLAHSRAQKHTTTYLFNLALTQHKRLFWDDGTVCIRMHSSRDRSPTPPSFRAGGRENKDNWLHKLSTHSPARSTQTGSDCWTAVHTTIHSQHISQGHGSPLVATDTQAKRHALRVALERHSCESPVFAAASAHGRMLVSSRRSSNTGKVRSADLPPQTIWAAWVGAKR